MEWVLPLRDPGPQLPDDVKTELDLFRVYITDDILEHFIETTNDYAEAIKEAQPIMYQRFRKHPLTKAEMLRYIGEHLLLSINSIRSYRKAWDQMSSQVSLTGIPDVQAWIHSYMYHFCTAVN